MKQTIKSKTNGHVLEYDTNEVQTTENGIQYVRNWEEEGSIWMLNEKTLDTYIGLTYKNDILAGLDCFFAFRNEQFDEGLQKLKDKGCVIDKDHKIISIGAGGFFTKQALDEYEKRVKNKDKYIKEHCDPQEVYFYEWNNHECMINWDGDIEPYNIVKGIWGEEVAKKLHRLNAYEHCI